MRGNRRAASRPLTGGSMLLAAAWAGLSLAAAAHAQWVEGFESEQPAWQVPKDTAGYRLINQTRSVALAHHGLRCEQLRWSVGQQQSELRLELPVGQWPIVDELRLSLWVRSDQPVVTLAVRAVLPRSLDPATGQPVTCLIEGTSYQTPGEWQQLGLEQVPEALRRRVRSLRLEHRRNIDERESYIDRVVLLVRAAAGELSIWTDDLELHGPPRPQHGKAALPAAVKTSLPRLSVELAGTMLLVEGRPVIPRLAEYHGESLSFLKQLGFHGIWLHDPPDAQLLRQAAHEGMWVVCPPPALEEAVFAGQTADYGPVLAWEMGGGLLPQDVPGLARQARRLRQADAPAPRPLVAEPLAGARELSRYVQILRAQRLILGSTCELRDVAAWLRALCQTADAASAWWAHVPTAYAPGLEEQLAAIEPGSAVPVPGEEQLGLLAHVCLAAGVRGLIFQSDSRLDGQGPEAQARAAALALVLHRIELLEALVIGSRLACVAQCDQQEILAPVLQNDRFWVVLPMWLARGAQCVCGSASATGITLTIPGVPEAYEAYQLTPSGVVPLKRQRAAGGVHVTLQELDVAGVVLLTSDATILSALHRRATALGRRSADLTRSLAAWRQQRVLAIDRRLAAQGRRLRASEAHLGQAQRLLESCTALQQAGDWSAALHAATSAARELRLLERAHWEGMSEELGTPASSAALASFAGLPLAAAVTARAGGTWGPNRLPAAARAQEEEMRAAGWQSVTVALPGVAAEARLAAHAEDGVHPVRLAVERAVGVPAPDLVETAPVWVESPAIPVRKGEWLRIRGRVWLEGPVTGSIDGLMIIDSLGGLGMAERVAAAEDWQPFVLYRVAPADGEMYLTFALTGYGVAWLDELAVESLGIEGQKRPFPAARRQLERRGGLGSSALLR